MDTSNFWTVNWYYFAALTVAIFSATIAFKNFKKKDKITALPENNNTNNNVNTNTNTNTNTNSNSNNNQVNVHFHQQAQNEDSFDRDAELEKLRRTTGILFIDDDSKFKVVKILVNEGWGNTKSIVDLKSYNDDDLKRSDIIFVDVQGVGKALDCKDEGLGLALNIKTRFPQKKVIIYSAVPGHNLFHDAIQRVDDLLSKDAEPYEFISLIERLSLELR